MAKQYIPDKMMQHSRFSKYYEKLSAKDLAEIEHRIGVLIEENRELCVPISYAHLCNLFSALAIHQLDMARGLDAQESRAKILSIMKEYLIPRKKAFQRFFKIPGTFALGRKLIPKMMMQGNGYGWDTVLVASDKDTIAFDTRQCIFATLMKKYGVPELGCTFCEIDDYLYSELPGISFERTGTVCRGDACCDFRFVKKK